MQALGFSQIWNVAAIDKELSNGAYRLLAIYVQYAQQKGACFPSVERLANDMGVTERTIVRWNSELTKLGYITRERREHSTSITFIEDATQIKRLQEIATGQICPVEAEAKGVTGQECPVEEYTTNSLTITSSSPSEKKKSAKAERIEQAREAGDSVPAKARERKRPRVIAHPKRKQTDHSRMVRTLAAAFRWPDKLSQRQRGRLSKLAVRVLEGNYPPEMVREVGEAWWTTWPGNQGPGNDPTDDKFMERLEQHRVAMSKWRVVSA